ncbi:MAG: LamG-like jellyroll fold domain-containing protein, partial [Dehalococcoidales bacterium]|nr:LamG-like jellyroll fold domain-containing protein [Dehalococcoidales bacterium]
GTIDDVRIYSRALSAGEVTQLYKQGAAKLAVSPVNSLKSGLVGWWTFDGKDTNWGTNRTNDLSGNGNTLKMVSMSTSSSPVAGKIGQAFSLLASVTPSIQEVTSSSSLKPTSGNFSWGSWVKPIKSVADAGGDQIIQWDGGTTNGYYLGIDNVLGQGFTCFVNLSTTDATFDYVPPAYSTKRWEHLFCVYDDTAKIVYGYMNGVLVSSSSAGDGTITYPAFGFQRMLFEGGQVFDDARFYNRALSAGEVTQLYKLGAAKLAVSPVNSLKTGLVGYWTFDGKDTNWGTNKTNDLSGQGNTGTLVSMSTTTSPVAGKIGQGFKFDNTNDRISTASAAGSLDIAGPITISAWIYPKSSGEGSVARIVDKAGASGLVGYQFSMGSSNNLSFAVGTAGGVNVKNSDVNTITLNTWQFVTAVNNGSNTTFYVNGISKGSPAQPAPLSTTITLAIGNRSGDTDRTFDGVIDDVRIYNRALSVQEINLLYKLGFSKSR